ncbi:MAG TPA: GTP cyclohydrolase I, partial [Gemmatimonadaceae bacterium]
MHAARERVRITESAPAAVPQQGLALVEGYADHVRRQLSLLGEDPAREGLLKTPERVATAMEWLTRGYGLTAEDVVGDAVFAEEHSNMVL